MAEVNRGVAPFFILSFPPPSLALCRDWFWVFALTLGQMTHFDLFVYPLKLSMYLFEPDN